MHLRTCLGFHHVMGHNLSNPSLPVNTAAMNNTMLHKPSCILGGVSLRSFLESQWVGQRASVALGPCALCIPDCPEADVGGFLWHAHCSVAWEYFIYVKLHEHLAICLWVNIEHWSLFLEVLISPNLGFTQQSGFKSLTWGLCYVKNQGFRWLSKCHT